MNDPLPGSEGGSSIRDDYERIFNERGDSYDRAMRLEPDARRAEFENVLGLLDLRDGEWLCDMPSGGGYVHQYLGGRRVNVISIETSRAFYDLCQRTPSIERHLCALDATPLEAGRVDAVMSLAGLHHLRDRPAVYREAHRILRPGGRIALADVRTGSTVDPFLNEFVHANCSMGHDGNFLDDSTSSELETAGFDVEVFEMRRFAWRFGSARAMAEYCRMLFGIDRCGVDTVLEAIEQMLGYREVKGTCEMNWELLFVLARKPLA